MRQIAATRFSRCLRRGSARSCGGWGSMRAGSATPSGGAPAPAEGGVPYLVSEYVEGRTLAETIAARGPAGIWSPAEAADLTARISEILDYAHRQKVIHRDIKP